MYWNYYKGSQLWQELLRRTITLDVLKSNPRDELTDEDIRRTITLDVLKFYAIHRSLLDHGYEEP